MKKKRAKSEGEEQRRRTRRRAKSENTTSSTSERYHDITCSNQRAKSYNPFEPDPADFLLGGNTSRSRWRCEGDSVLEVDDRLLRRRGRGNGLLRDPVLDIVGGPLEIDGGMFGVHSSSSLSGENNWFPDDSDRDRRGNHLLVHEKGFVPGNREVERGAGGDGSDVGDRRREHWLVHK